MTLTRVTKGESVTGSLTAETWNAFIDTANAATYAGDRPGDAKPAEGELPCLTALCEAGSQIDQSEIVGIGSPAITPTEDEQTFQDRVSFSAGAVADVYKGLFGIARTAIPPGTVDLAAVSGVCQCKLYVPANGDWIERADIYTADKTQLLATPEGSAQILWKSSGTATTVDAIIRFGVPQYVCLPGKTDGAVTANNSVTVSIWSTGSDTFYNVDDVYLDWMHNSEAISVGKEVLIGYFPSEKRWRFVGAECES